jgi:hypothetical protein
MPATSTASRATPRDDRDTPSLRARDGANHTPDLRFWKSEIFSNVPLDANSKNQPVGQISILHLGNSGQ